MSGDQFQTLFPNAPEPKQPGKTFEPPAKNDNTERNPSPESDRPTSRTAVESSTPRPSVTQRSEPPSSSNLVSSHTVPDSSVNRFITREVESGEVIVAEALRQQLIDLRIVRESEWDLAANAVGGTSDAIAVLHRLHQTPASWKFGDFPRFNILTNYQLQQILLGNAERLRLGHYLVLEKVGSGGMGDVYISLNLSLTRLEAIKTIAEDFSEGTQESQTLGLARFEQEARLLAQLNHRYITTVYHYGRENDVAYIAMEYVKGRSLKTIVEEANQRNQMLPVDWTVERFQMVAEALDHAHQHGIIHRDVKPGNIMITDRDELKVLDLGIARLVNPQTMTKTMSGQERLTRDSAGLGTPDVMPPEQWADASAVTPVSDLYSLGCTLYYVLAGRMPFVAGNVNSLMFAHANSPPPSLRDIRSDVSERLDNILRKLMAKEPEDRFQTASELIEAFCQWREEADAPPPPPPPSFWSQWGPWVVGAGAVTLAVLFVIVAPRLFPTKTKSLDSKPGIVSTGEGDWSEKAAKFLEEFQGKQSDVWSTLGQINEFVKEKEIKVANSSDLETLKSKVDGETETRRRVRTEAYEFFRKHAGDNKRIYGSLDTLLSKLGSSESDVKLLHRRGEFERLKLAALEDTKKQWRRLADESLENIRDQLADVWKSDDDLETYLKSKSLNRNIETEEQLDALIASVSQESYQRKLNLLLANEQKQNPSVWKTVGDVTAFAKEQNLRLDRKENLDLTVQAVRKQTQIRIQRWASDELNKFYEESKPLWPNVSELQKAIGQDVKTITSQAEVDKLLRLAEETSSKLLEGSIRPDREDRVWLFLRTGNRLLRSPRSQKTGVVETRLTVEDTVRQTLKPDEEFWFEVKAKRAGFPVLTIFGDENSVHFFQWIDPVKEGSWIKLVKFTAPKTAGAERFDICLAPIAPPTMPPGVLVMGGNTDNRRVAVVSLFKTPSREEGSIEIGFDDLKECFAREGVRDYFLQCLRKDVPPKFIKPDAIMGEPDFGRHRVETVVPKK